MNTPASPARRAARRPPSPPVRSGRSWAIGLSAFALAALQAEAAPAPSFSRVIADLPLPAGFVEAAGGASFPTTRGALFVTSGHCTCSAAELARFFATTLPNLGWRRQPAAVLTFVREHERLAIEAVAAAAGPLAGPRRTYVRFRLTVSARS